METLIQSCPISSWVFLGRSPESRWLPKSPKEIPSEVSGLLALFIGVFSVLTLCGFHNISRITGQTSKLLEINSSVTVKFSSRLAIHSGDTVKNTWKKALKTPSGKAPAAIVSSLGLSAKHAGDLPVKVWTALD